MPGPGTHLHAILAELGIHPGPACPCHEHAAMMDEWGSDRCRRERETIVRWLREAKVEIGWRKKMNAAARAVASGLAFSINLADPIGWLVDEAIRRSEASLSANPS